MILLKTINTFFTPAKKLSDKYEKEENYSERQQTLDMCVRKPDALKVEIIWTLKSVMNGFSVQVNDRLDHVS